MTVVDLTDFLLARIAEDEAAARGLWDWMIERHGPDVWTTGEGRHLGAEEWRYEADRDMTLHVSPRRVLAECEAKRLIVEAEPERWVLQPDAPGFTVDMGTPEGMVRVYGKLITEVEYRDRYMELAPPAQHLLLLALPYADHPEYREDWRP